MDVMKNNSQDKFELSVHHFRSEIAKHCEVLNVSYTCCIVSLENAIVLREPKDGVVVSISSANLFWYVLLVHLVVTAAQSSYPTVVG